MIYVGLDPGVKKTAFASIQGRKFIDAGFVPSSRGNLYNFFRNHPFINKAITFILERPDRLDQKSTVRDIINLSIVVGRIEGVLINERCITVSPLEWKGQTPKEVTRKRALVKYPDSQKVIGSFGSSIQHNLYDALGLAIYGKEIFK